MDAAVISLRTLALGESPPFLYVRQIGELKMAPIMVRPDTVFEASFFNTDDGSAWTDLSSYVEASQGINISRRRQVIFDDVSSGSMGLSLDNSLGTFNNDRADLPYFGLVNIDVPVRFRARWPRVPTDTINLLSDDQSKVNGADFFAVEQGTTDLDTADFPAGQSTSLIWNTGVLATVNNRVITGDFYSRSADDDLPMYVATSTQYTGSVKVKCDAAGTGITFKVSARILWYDNKGQPISESTGTSTTLTTSYATVSVTATSPANAYTARLAVANDTLVGPASAVIAVTGFTSDRVNRGGKLTHLTIQQETNVGDLAIVWLYAGAQPTFTPPDGTWTNFETAFNDLRGKAVGYYKILKQDDIGLVTEWSINQTGKHWLAMMTTYSGAHQTTPINAHTKATETLFQTTHTPPSITTTASNCWIQSVVFDTSSTTSIWTVPGSVTLRTNAFCTGGNAATGVMTDNNAAVAIGTYAGAVFTSNVKSKFASMCRVAIAPATGTGPGSVAVRMGAWQFEQSASASAWVAGGHWKDLFTGLTDSWTKTWAGEMSLMEVAATDRSKQLTATTVGPAVSETIKAALPVAYYTLSESGDASTTEGANSSIVPQEGVHLFQVGAGGTLEWGSGTGPPVDGISAVTVTKSDINNGAVLQTTLTNPVTNADSITLMCWFNSTDTDTSSTLTAVKAAPKNAGGVEYAYCEIRGTSGTNLQANGSVKSEYSSAIATAVNSVNYFNGKTHFAVAVLQIANGSLTSTLYVDGVQTATSSTATPATIFPDITTLSIANAFPTKHIMSGTYSHVALFDYAVDPDTIANIYTAGTTAFAGDTVDERIARICLWSGIDDVNLDTSTTICDRHMPDSQTAISAVQQAAKTDGGTAFIDDDGRIRFLSRANKEDTVTSWLTVTAGQVDVGMTEVTDDQLLINQANIKRLGTNSIQVSNDLGSQVIHGIYNKDVDTIQLNVDDARYNGEYLTAFYADPVQRCDSVLIRAHFLQNWTTLLTQDMWNIIHITGLPSIEAVSTLDLYIEGWSYEINDAEWNVTYDTSAAIPFAILNNANRDTTGTVVVAW